MGEFGLEVEKFRSLEEFFVGQVCPTDRASQFFVILRERKRPKNLL